MVERTDYAFIQKLLHWLLAVFIVGMLANGLFMSSIGFGPEVTQEQAELRNFLYSMHKSSGFIILALMAVRVPLRLILGAPALPQSMPKIMRLAAGASHFALYALLIAMPIIGWAATSAGGFMEPVFGLFDMPPLLSKDPQMAGQLFQLHGLIGYAILGVLAAHIGGALLHLIILRDGVFKRMWF